MASKGKNNYWWNFGPASLPNLHNNFTLIIPRSQQERLATTCFRGKGRPLAGNFLFWESAGEMMSEIGSMVATRCDVVMSEIGSMVATQCDEEWCSQAFEARLTVQCDRVIGWQSTTTQSQEGVLQEKELEKFHLNRRTTAYRVKLEVGHHDMYQPAIDPSLGVPMIRMLAPLTNQVTMAITFHWQSNEGRWKGFIQTIYPGEDIGRLRPTTRKGNFLRGVTFFGWNHPGEIDSDKIPDDVQLIFE
ncbi:MAG: hypothetical protein WCW66_05940 [Patescibacteria group bacterium]|jgi:hypothetical protein